MGLTGYFWFSLVFYILSILRAGAKLFGEAWLILSENKTFMLLSFLFDQTGRFIGQRRH
jgi:hypothetical protein